MGWHGKHREEDNGDHSMAGYEGDHRAADPLPTRKPPNDHRTVYAGEKIAVESVWRWSKNVSKD